VPPVLRMASVFIPRSWNGSIHAEKMGATIHCLGDRRANLTGAVVDVVVGVEFCVLREGFIISGSAKCCLT